jgi:hypothetical protein
MMLNFAQESCLSHLQGKKTTAAAMVKGNGSLPWFEHYPLVV